MAENFEEKSGLWLPKEQSGHKISPEEMEKRKETVKEAGEISQRKAKEKQEAEQRKAKYEEWLKDPLRGARVRERIERAEEPAKEQEKKLEPEKAPEREPLTKTELDKEWVLGKRREMLKEEEGLKKRWGIPVETEGKKSKEELKQAEKAEKEQQRQIEKEKKDEEKLTKIEARIEEKKKKQEEKKREERPGVQAEMVKENGKTKKFWQFWKKGL